MGAFTAKVILTRRNAECFYRKRSIPASIFRCLEVGRPENRVVPIGGYPLRLRECDTII